METRELLGRIEVNPRVMLGKPVVRGTRITVEILLEKLAAGIGIDEILADYPVLERDDVLAALVYARQAEREDTRRSDLGRGAGKDQHRHVSKEARLRAVEQLRALRLPVASADQMKRKSVPFHPSKQPDRRR